MDYDGLPRERPESCRRKRTALHDGHHANEKHRYAEVKYHRLVVTCKKRKETKRHNKGKYAKSKTQHPAKKRGGVSQHMPVASGVSEIDVVCAPAVGIQPANSHEMPRINNYAYRQTPEKQEEHPPLRHLTRRWQKVGLDKYPVHDPVPCADICEEQDERHDKRERSLRRHYAHERHYGKYPPVAARREPAEHEMHADQQNGQAQFLGGEHTRHDTERIADAE